ncbi:hypothetical protein [Caballeronia sp. AZ10_KS36]|uniref:hypothetical protein n=1 Tax=Caballeronia sp. AZ10_KS36 TaxID=2921757 RepID=UPI002028F3C4|nr:hypothetical protein [Caballeronia sp. AZ10_KS36]
MKSAPQVLYKGFALTPVVVHEAGGLFTAMVIVRDPTGAVRASGEIGQFASVLEARSYAVQYGMADVDDRQPPMPDKQHA